MLFTVLGSGGPSFSLSVLSVCFGKGERSTHQPVPALDRQGIAHKQTKPSPAGATGPNPAHQVGVERAHPCGMHAILGGHKVRSTPTPRPPSRVQPQNPDLGDQHPQVPWARWGNRTTQRAKTKGDGKAARDPSSGPRLVYPPAEPLTAQGAAAGTQVGQKRKESLTRMGPR